MTFLYNGGPGKLDDVAAHGIVRTGSRRRPATAPSPGRRRIGWSTIRYSLLDKTDLVFIDMPGSGYGRIIGAGTRKDFWGVDEDADAFAQFIQRYLTNFNRWNSPNFLFGESYGTTRSSVLASDLQDRGIALNGIVLLSSFLNSNIDYNDGAPIGGGDWAYILYLPTEAATAWYHHALSGAPSLNALLSEVQNFALGEYLDALGQGAQLAPDRYNDIVAKLHRYTGLSDQYIRNSNLRIPYDRFQNELLRERGITVGRLDSRFRTYVLDRPQVSPDWDATDAAIDGAFVSTSNYYLRQVLKYNTPLLYRGEIYDLIYRRRQDLGLQTRSNVQVLNVTPDLAQSDDLQPEHEGLFGERILRFRDAVFCNGVRAQSSLSRAGAATKYYVRLLRLGTHGLSASRARSRSFMPIWNAGTPERSPMRSVILTFLAAALLGASRRAGGATGSWRPTRRDAVTKHTIALGGRTYPYTARAGTIALENEQGETTCRMFYTAFTARRRRSAHAPGDVLL